MLNNIRIEEDLLGTREVPADAYYGVHTLRAIENFYISNSKISDIPEFVRGMVMVKKAAALANKELQTIPKSAANAIIAACDEVLNNGKCMDQFPVDVFQGGAGTSVNMNTNEVLANIGLELMGHQKGEYQYLNPNDHVNKCQSTNDAYPTGFRIAVYASILKLIDAIKQLGEGFQAKAVEFQDILKMGRTQLQDAVPMTLGQEFQTYAIMLGEDEERLKEAALLIREINLGATAIGTGICADPDYTPLVCRKLAEISGIPVITAPNLIEATQDCGAFVQLSGVLKRVAVKLSKSCNDLRLLSSGPRAGLGEINLPPRQAGSSIMPGKVNPVIPEVVNQIAFEVIGNDMTVTFAAEAGQLQLNAFEPIIAHSLFKSVNHLRRGCVTLADLCVDGITANRELLMNSVRNSIGIVTALNPYIGYAHATEVAAEAHATGKGVAEIVLAKGLMSKERLDEVLRPEVLTCPQELEPIHPVTA